MKVTLHDEMQIGEPYSHFRITIGKTEMKLRRFSDGKEEYFEIFNKETHAWDFDISQELYEEIEMLF